MDINEAKKILEKYDYDWKEIEDNNADKDFKKFNVPKEIVQQWYLEGYKKRIFDFKSKFLSGEDA